MLLGVLFSHKGALCYKQILKDYTGLAVLDKSEESGEGNGTAPSVSWAMAASQFCGELPATNACIHKAHGRHTTAQHSSLLAETFLTYVCVLCSGKSIA